MSSGIIGWVYVIAVVGFLVVDWYRLRTIKALEETIAIQRRALYECAKLTNTVKEAMKDGATKRKDT